LFPVLLQGIPQDVPVELKRPLAMQQRARRKNTFGAGKSRSGIDSHIKSDAPKYRLLERYVARNVNGKK
jgi:hypothetical protein